MINCDLAQQCVFISLITRIVTYTTHIYICDCKGYVTLIPNQGIQVLT